MSFTNPNETWEQLEARWLANRAGNEAAIDNKIAELRMMANNIAELKRINAQMENDDSHLRKFNHLRNCGKIETVTREEYNRFIK